MRPSLRPPLTQDELNNRRYCHRRALNSVPSQKVAPHPRGRLSLKLASVRIGFGPENELAQTARQTSRTHFPQRRQRETVGCAGPGSRWFSSGRTTRFLAVCPVLSIPVRGALRVSDTRHDHRQEPVEFVRLGPVMCNHVTSSRHAPAAPQAEKRASDRKGKATHHLHSRCASWPAQLSQAVCYICSLLVALLPRPRR